MRNTHRIWIAGANGRLGQAIYKLLDLCEYEVLNTDIEDVDITNAEEVITFSDRNRFDIIVNCAGMTDLDECEKNLEMAYKVNALGARNLSIAARKHDSKIIHISTDDVFGGSKTSPYTEFDLPNPTTVYGKSKLAGEFFVKEFAPRHMIIRSSWLYGEGDSFVKAILDAADNSTSVKVAVDQVASPTSAVELAKFIVSILNTSEYGTYHATCKGQCSRFEFAKEILKAAGKQADIIPVPTGESVTSDRPRYTVLDNFMLRISGVYEMKNWQTALEEYIKKLN